MAESFTKFATIDGGTVHVRPDRVSAIQDTSMGSLIYVVGAVNPFAVKAPADEVLRNLSLARI